MREIRIACRSLAETARLGGALAGVVRAGDTIALRGELGAGKTTLVRMLCAGLGVAEGIVSSPTFVIAQEYPVVGRAAGRAAAAGEGGEGAALVPIGRVVHIDAYRLRSAGELEEAATGAFAPDAVTVVEWPERCAGAMPSGMIEVEIGHAGGPEGEEARWVVVRVPERAAGRSGMDRLEALEADGRADVLAGGRTGGRVDTTCPVTGRFVAAECPTWPFSDERARMADLERWFSGRYTVSRPAERSDIEEGD